MYSKIKKLFIRYYYYLNASYLSFFGNKRSIKILLNKIIKNTVYTDEIYKEGYLFYNLLSKIIPTPNKDWKPKNSPNKILICVNRIKLEKVHSHVYYFLGIAGCLASINRNIEIIFLITNECTISPEGVKRHGPQEFKDLSFIEEQAQRMWPENYGKNFFIKLLNFDVGSGLEPILESGKFINLCKPDAIIYFGGKYNDSLILRRSLYEYYPTIFLFTQIKNKPDKYCDIIAPFSEADLDGSFDKRKLKITKIPGPFLPADKTGKIHVKKTPDELTIVTVLSKNRIARAFQLYSDEMVDSFMTILDNVKNARWIFLGTENPDLFYSTSKEILKRKEKGQLEGITYIENLSGFMEEVDLFLHLPEMTGGGGGSSIAISKEVPVLTFKNSDVASRVPDNSVYENHQYKKFVDHSIQLLESKHKRTQLTLLQKQHMDQLSKDSKLDLYSRCIDAVNEFHLRKLK